MIRRSILFLFVVVLTSGVPASADEVHAVREAWVHADAAVTTRVHHEEDPLCWVEFDEQCFGGMMAPDSLLCEFEPLPMEEWPEQCSVAVDCRVTDPAGQPTMDGGGMHAGMMRREVTVTMHYDPDELADWGLEPGDLCLARREGERFVICDGAVQDVAASNFTLSTFAPAAAYAVLPRAIVVSTTRPGISGLKSRY